MKLHYHDISEEPLMVNVVDQINVILFDAQSKGLSLSGGLNCLAHAMTMVLVSAYDNNATRLQVASALPDLITAYVPQWERLTALAKEHARATPPDLPA